MTAPANWLIPIILLPGVALLILSTSARFAQIHEEIHRIIHTNEPIETPFKTHLQKRAVLFRNALVLLYISVAFFALGSISGALLDLLNNTPDLAVFLFAFIGIMALITAAILLIIESSYSLQVIIFHLDTLPTKEEKELV
jgi:hypothetical protein